MLRRHRPGCRARADEHGPLCSSSPPARDGRTTCGRKAGQPPPVHRRRHPRGPGPRARADHSRSFEGIEQTRAGDGGGRRRGGPRGRAPPAHSPPRVHTAPQPPLDHGADRRPEDPNSTGSGRSPQAFSDRAQRRRGGRGERDKIAADDDGGTIAMLRERLPSGTVLAAPFGPAARSRPEATRRWTA